ncbi:putative bifunctional diguanylate cyclase/phosphodiesterase [Kamptonema formosum]|uniref:putative bifunctional diguanylate cyclase/phosphodiesterase n=1 Tax=Kamptonema formosum TaxID=331992 RepID=UPI00034A2F8E|nr:GGDEF domain-containing response regulator [Oscillatoria sp. PCC 10802]
MKKILVIEDEDTIRENILDLLEAENFEGFGADNGLAGVKLARERQPDLILCDLMMPVIDGYRVLTLLRAEPATASIPFIFLTALGDRAHMRTGMELGADDYLTKPCRPDELLRAIQTRLEKQEAMQQHYMAEIQRASDKLNDLLYCDSLTQLPNRLSLAERFSQILNSCAPTDTGKLIPVLCVGLDRFNRINDTFGHERGDLLLKDFAQRLTASLDTGATAARLNGDQFAILLPPADKKQDAASVAQTIQDSLSQPFLSDSQEVFLTASTGIALHPRDGTSLEKLLQHASQGMHLAKQHGGNQYQFYTAAFLSATPDDLTLETDLRYALERDEFQVYYQPQVSLETGEIAGAEALLRWHHPKRGLISPARFIPLAEATGLIVPLGERVLSAACRQAQGWHQAGFSGLRVAVNLSSRQFSQLNMRQRLTDILIETGFSPTYLDLELTESVLLENSQAAIRRLSALKALGLQIAIDDFGTGYSSLRYLQQFPFDILKIDRTFVSNLSADLKNTAITAAAIDLAHHLNLKVTAEGVETEAELAFLRLQQCDKIQGYLFSRPLPAAEFEKLLLAGKTLPFQPGSK